MAFSPNGDKLVVFGIDVNHKVCVLDSKSMTALDD